MKWTKKGKKTINRPRTITYTNIIPIHCHQLDKVILKVYYNSNEAFKISMNKSNKGYSEGLIKTLTNDKLYNVYSVHKKEDSIHKDDDSSRIIL